MAGFNNGNLNSLQQQIQNLQQQYQNMTSPNMVVPQQVPMPQPVQVPIPVPSRQV